MKIIRYESPAGVIGYAAQHPDGTATQLRGSLFDGLKPTGEPADIARLLAPLNPPAILCIGLNYRQHAEETNAPIPVVPVLFMKNIASLNHPGAPIEIPRWLASSRVDYECELAVVIGRRAKNVPRERALDYIGDHRRRLITTVVPRRIGRMWGVYRPLHQIDLDVLVEARDKRVSTLSYVQYLVLVPCAIGGIVVSKRRKYPLLATGLWAVLATVTAAGTFGNTRYRTAGEVSFVLLASVGLVALASRRLGSAEPAQVDAEVGDPVAP